MLRPTPSAMLQGCFRVVKVALMSSKVRNEASSRRWATEVGPKRCRTSAMRSLGGTEVASSIEGELGQHGEFDCQAAKAGVGRELSQRVCLVQARESSSRDAGEVLGGVVGDVVADPDDDVALWDGPVVALPDDEAPRLPVVRGADGAVRVVVACALIGPNENFTCFGVVPCCAEGLRAGWRVAAFEGAGVGPFRAEVGGFPSGLESAGEGRSGVEQRNPERVTLPADGARGEQSVEGPVEALGEARTGKLRGFEEEPVFLFGGVAMTAHQEAAWCSIAGRTDPWCSRGRGTALGERPAL